MNVKNTIIEHYKKFFDLHAKGIALDEDDHLNIDWAEDLVKNCFIPNVVGRNEQSVCQESKLDCPYDFTSRCTLGRCDCTPKAN